MRMPVSRPIFLRSAGSAVTALLDEPASGDPGKAAVLICPPWGWDEVASYRARRDWARQLGAAGRATLRLELPGTGNSGGSPGQSELVADWVDSIRVAALWLAARGGAAGVAVLGLGLGGLLAIEAISAGAPIEQLVLWAAPPSGRKFVRETKAFSRLQAWHAGSDAEDLDAGLPEGWLEAGGFTLSAATQADLGKLELAPAADSALRRALLLDRDGIAPDHALASALESAGAAVSAAPGPGWAEMVSHPERSALPVATARNLERWLEEDADPPRARAAPAPTPDVEAGELVLEHDGARLHEVSLSLEQPWGCDFGVLASPAGDRVPDLCAVFLNAGAVRSTGPSRMWVETARAWAARGVPSLRVDLEGIGEADGEPSGSMRVTDFYLPRYQPQLTAILDDLAARGAGTKFILVGLCAGGFWAFRTAVADPRVVAAVPLNAGALRWHPDLLAERESRKASRAFERRWWKKLFEGDIGVAKLRVLAVSIVVNAARCVASLVPRLTGRGRPEVILRGIEADLDLLAGRGTRVLVGLSGEEPLGREIESGGLSRESERWPRTEFAALPGEDHTLRPVAAQLAARELLDRELERQIGPRPAAVAYEEPAGRQR